MQIAVVIKSAASMRPTWTTAALIAAGQRLGHRLWVIEEHDVSVQGGSVCARAFRMPSGDSAPDRVAHQITRRTAARARIALENVDLLLLRTVPIDPATLSLAMLLETRGVHVVNRPAGLVQLTSKAWLAAQDLPLPHTLVTRSRGEAHVFHATHGDLVVKPDRGSGGHSVSKVDRGDDEVLDEAFTKARRNNGRVVLQERIVDPGGEKRLVWCDGAVLGGYRRIAAQGEFRHNLRQGGTPAPLDISVADRELGCRVAEVVSPLGIRFAGLDVLGGRLIEINALNPGGTVHADALHGTGLADRVMRSLTSGELHHGLASPSDQETGRRSDRSR